MLPETVTLHLPEALYQRLVNTARATQRTLEEVLLQAVRAGSPPAWDDVPPEFQADLAQMDRMSDDDLWQIARLRQTPDDAARYAALLALKQSRPLADAERVELDDLRQAADRLMIRKAHAAALLRWRGHAIPIP